MKAVREDILQLIRKAEAKEGRRLDGHEQDLIWRCAWLGFKENQILLTALQKMDPIKEEYVIVCFLDGIDDKFVENEIINEPDIEVIKRKRLDFLLDKFRTEDETYKRLLYEQEQMQREIAAAEEKVRQFSGIVNAYEKEKNDRQNGKQEIQIENEKLKSRIRQLEGELIRARSEKGDEVATRVIEKVRTYRKPDSFSDKLKFIFTGQIEEEEYIEEVERPTEKERTEEKPQVNIIEVLCNPELTLEQVQELQQGIIDGLPAHEIASIAKPDITIEVMAELRKFMCLRNGIEFTSVEREEDNDRKEAAGDTIDASNGDEEISGDAEQDENEKYSDDQEHEFDD